MGARLIESDDQPVITFGTTEHTQLLRQVRRFEPNIRDQLTHRPFPIPKQLEHANARRMSERLEELRLDLIDAARHSHDLPTK